MAPQCVAAPPPRPPPPTALVRVTPGRAGYGASRSGVLSSWGRSRPPSSQRWREKDPSQRALHSPRDAGSVTRTALLVFQKRCLARERIAADDCAVGRDQPPLPGGLSGNGRGAMHHTRSRGHLLRQDNSHARRLDQADCGLCMCRAADLCPAPCTEHPPSIPVRRCNSGRRAPTRSSCGRLCVAASSTAASLHEAVYEATPDGRAGSPSDRPPGLAAARCGHRAAAANGAVSAARVEMLCRVRWADRSEPGAAGPCGVAVCRAWTAHQPRPRLPDGVRVGRRQA